jgi:hypothetical protein
MTLCCAVCTPASAGHVSPGEGIRSFVLGFLRLNYRALAKFAPHFISRRPSLEFRYLLALVLPGYQQYSKQKFIYAYTSIMAKSRRKQAINKQKQDKAKELRKRKADLAELKAKIQPHLDEADRLMKEADALFKQALVEKAEVHQPGFDSSPSFFMRMLYRALENDKEFKSAFYTPPEDWQPPMVKTTRYGLANRHYWERISKALKYDLGVYLTTLESYYKLIGSNKDRALCSECAKYDWRHHLTAFFDGLPVDWANVDHKVCTIDQQREITSSLGGEYKLSRYDTSFKLPGLTHAIEHEQKCTFCSLLVSASKVVTTKEQFDHIAKDAQPVEISCYNPFSKNHGDRWVLYARFCSDEQAAVGDWDVVVLRFVLHASSSSLIGDPFIKEALQKAGRSTIAPMQIDPALIPSWLQKCKEEHVGCRVKARDPKFNTVAPNALLRVIDVQKDEIVIAPKSCAYIALSYVWGGIDGYLSRKCNKSRDLLTEDEIIPFRRNRLPKTIHDAIRVTEMIGERYLWVDALCIVQDDDVEKARTIAVMNNIYRNALLTVAAADGKDADVGLVGLDPGSRHIQSVVGSVDNIFLTLEEPAPELAHSVWSSRAWTYQEEQFSRRLLIFAHDRVYYKCDQGSFGEARPHQRLNDSILATKLDPKLMNIHDDNDQVLYAYTQHVQGYTSRQLTYEADILHALEGLLSYISSTSKSEYMFFWGLPQVDLVFALAWRPAPSHMPLRRRTAQTRYLNGVAEIVEKQRFEPRDTAIDFPSWSWAGWVGPVAYDIFEYPKLSCWGETSCFFSTTLDFPWKVQDEAAAEALLAVLCEGILTFTADVATLEYEQVKEYEKQCADDDSCEQCRGQTQVRTQVLIMDDKSVWESGTKEGILLLAAVGFIDDFKSHTVLLFRRDAETGVCYREGILELQRREWEATKPSREKLRLG